MDFHNFFTKLFLGLFQTHINIKNIFKKLLPIFQGSLKIDCTKNAPKIVIKINININ